jgi:hypothetical protein
MTDRPNAFLTWKGKRRFHIRIEAPGGDVDLSCPVYMLNATERAFYDAEAGEGTLLFYDGEIVFFKERWTEEEIAEAEARAAELAAYFAEPDAPPPGGTT